MVEWKEGDVFSWSWNDKMLNKLFDGNNSGTTYWCKSQIGIVYKDGMLHDTFWNSGNDTRWCKERADDELELTYLGNLNDYRKAEPYERACYKDEDFMDLNHPNSPRGNFYIRKDAKQSNEKKRKIILRSKLKLEREIAYQLSQIERYQKLLDTKSYEEMLSLPVEKNVSLSDSCWDDK